MREPLGSFPLGIGSKGGWVVAITYLSATYCHVGPQHFNPATVNHACRNQKGQRRFSLRGVVHSREFNRSLSRTARSIKRSRIFIEGMWVVHPRHECVPG